MAIIGAYVPQYQRIWRDGTKGISPYYVLNHALFSSTTLALRFSHSIFYVTFNCVTGGELGGWKGYSASLDFLAVFVQWACAMVLYDARFRTMILDWTDQEPQIRHIRASSHTCNTARSTAGSPPIGLATRGGPRAQAHFRYHATIAGHLFISHAAYIAVAPGF